jgi:hypothetical protein
VPNNILFLLQRLELRYPGKDNAATASIYIDFLRKRPTIHQSIAVLSFPFLVIGNRLGGFEVPPPAPRCTKNADFSSSEMAIIFGAMGAN